MCLVIGKFLRKRIIIQGRLVGALHLQDQRHQRFGDKPPAMHAETATLVGLVTKGIQVHIDHDRSGLRQVAPVRAR